VDDATTLATRANMHAALGDPVRLGIAEELARSDRTSSELALRFRVPTNLLAHHLGVLERAGLLLRTPSSGDRRRRYVRLRRERLADLHLRTPMARGRVLFVCTHNAARSQLAAALWRRRTGDEATSAGTRPARRVHPGAVAAARRAGVDIAGAEPRLLEDADLDADLVVTVCDRAHEQLEASATWLHWSIPDPAVAGTEAAFDETVAALDERIATLTA
jgi:ArsR family transcriptional regulator, arsenate/arsenite/antimonite-responsive transcriptional repressor / arsenate reductase (thioredoxin)